MKTFSLNLEEELCHKRPQGKTNGHSDVFWKDVDEGNEVTEIRGEAEVEKVHKLIGDGYRYVSPLKRLTEGFQNGGQRDRRKKRFDVK